MLGTVFNVHRDIETTWTERASLHRLVEPTKPVRRELIDRPDSQGRRTGPRYGDFVYDIPIKEELEACLKHDLSLLDKLRAAADAWKKTRPERGAGTTVYVDISDGKVLQRHPELGVHADWSDGSLRLAFILYYDDLEVVNPLGAFHGRHKLGMFYWTLVNNHQAERMSFANIHLMTVALSSDIDYYGINQVVSGIDGDTSFGSCMTALDTGIRVAIPNGEPVLVRGWCVCPRCHRCKSPR